MSSIIEWRPVVGLEKLYIISEHGEVLRSSAQRGTVVGKRIKGAINIKGYRKVRLTDGVKAKGYFIHRLVCAAWYPNPNNLPQVNHKDGRKENNHYSNLEWCDNSHNVKHKVENGLSARSYLGKFGKDHNRSIKIKGINLSTNDERIFHGGHEASRELKLLQGSISNVLSGRVKSTGGWKFIRL